MIEFWTSVIVKKSRKKYHCEYCNAPIEIGSSYSRESGKYEGEMQDYALCLRCRKLLDSNNKTWECDGELGNFHDSFIESKAIDCPHCGSIYCESVSYTKDMMRATIVCDSCDEIYRVDLSAENLLSAP
jgi:hypothetical protein